MKSIGLAYSLKGNKKKLCVTVPFLICFMYLRAVSKYKPLRAYVRKGDLTGFFCVTSLGGYIWRHLYTK